MSKQEKADWKGLLLDLVEIVGDAFVDFMDDVSRRVVDDIPPFYGPVAKAMLTLWAISMIGYPLVMEYAYFRAPERYGYNTIFAEPGFFDNYLSAGWDLLIIGVFFSLFAYLTLAMLCVLGDYARPTPQRK